MTAEQSRENAQSARPQIGDLYACGNFGCDNPLGSSAVFVMPGAGLYCFERPCT